MKYLLFFIIPFLLYGCECDSICVANRQTTTLLENYESESEVASFLNKYNGEGPGSEKFAVFVAWGVKNPEHFISIMNNKSVSSKTMKMVSYTISDIGYSSEYCEILHQKIGGRNLETIRRSLLGCSKDAS